MALLQDGHMPLSVAALRYLNDSWYIVCISSLLKKTWLDDTSRRCMNRNIDACFGEIFHGSNFQGCITVIINWSTDYVLSRRNHNLLKKLMLFKNLWKCQLNFFHPRSLKMAYFCPMNILKDIIILALLICFTEKYLSVFNSFSSKNQTFDSFSFLNS